MIYFIAQRLDPEGPIKIGFTGDIGRRMSSLAVGIPGGVLPIATLKGGLETEAFLHEKFAHLRMGGEWFRQDEDLRQFIQDAQNGKPGLVPFVEPKRHLQRSPAEIAADCIAEAKEMLAFLLGQEFRGPGDTIDAALHRLEMKTGIPRTISMRIRHRQINDMLVSNYFVVKEAYDAAVARRRERAKDGEAAE